MDKINPCQFHPQNIGYLAHLPLKRGCYFPHDLINGVIDEIEKIPTSQDLIRARDELCHAIVKGYAEKFKSDRPSHHKHIRRCAELIDQLFFAGQLTQTDRYRSQKDRYCLEIDIRLFDPEMATWSMSSIITDCLDSPPTRARIDINTYGDYYSVADIICFVIHEMAHCFIDLFSCEGGACNCIRSHYTQGRHGLHLFDLLDSIRRVIASWVPAHPKTSEFAKSDAGECSHPKRVPRVFRTWIRRIFSKHRKTRETKELR